MAWLIPIKAVIAAPDRNIGRTTPKNPNGAPIQILPMLTAPIIPATHWISVFLGDRVRRATKTDPKTPPTPPIATRIPAYTCQFETFSSLSTNPGNCVWIGIPITAIIIIISRRICGFEETYRNPSPIELDKFMDGVSAVANLSSRPIPVGTLKTVKTEIK